jgi:hypothetical protein
MKKKGNKTKKKTAKSQPLDYQTAKFLWALQQIVPNNAHILKEARRVARIDPIDCWSVDVFEFIETYEEKFGKVKKAVKLPPELTDFKFIPISEGVSIVYTPGEPPHSQN